MGRHLKVGCLAGFLVLFFIAPAMAGDTATTSSTLALAVTDTSHPILTWGAWAGKNASTVSQTANVTLLSNEPLRECNLTVNATLYNMTHLTYLSWWQNLTSMPVGNYTIWANCTDGSGNRGNTTIAWWRAGSNVTVVVVPPSGGGGGGGGITPPIVTNQTATGAIIFEEDFGEMLWQFFMTSWVLILILFLISVSIGLYIKRQRALA